MKELYNQLFQKHDTEDNTSLTYMDSLQRDIAIGSWEVNLQTDTVIWSAMTKTIHEVEQDYKPNVKEGVNFFLEGYNRDLISLLFARAVNDQQSYDREFQLKTAKNNIKWVRIVAYPVIEDNKTKKVIGVLQDITEKNNTLNELKLKEELIRTTFEHAPNGMALVSLSGEIITLNKTFCDYLGYTTEELIGCKINKLSHPGGIDIIPANIKNLIDGVSDKFECEKRYIKKDGSYINCILSISILRNENNQPIHFISHLIDITERKVAHKEAETLLTTTKSQNEKLLNFAHIVSHNLRSHSGNLEMLLDIMKTDIPECTENEFFPLIEEAVNNLSETISNLNEVSIINSKESKDLKAVNLLKTTHTALANFKASIIATDAKINISIDSNIYVLVIPAYLDSILFNLISNSIKYKRPDATPVINISAQQTTDFIKITVSDNGLGIDLNLHKKKIFGLYKTFHKHQEARGLGLYITKNQVEAMNGKINVSSKPNEGTTFTIHLKHEAH